MIRTRPEITLPILTWIVTLLAAWMRYPLVGDPYGMGTLWYIGLTLTCIVVPALLFGGSSKQGDGPTVPSWGLTAATTAALLIAIGITFWTRREFAHLDLEGQRSTRGDVTSSTLARLNYVFRALGLLSPFLLALSVRRLISAVAVFLALVGFAVFVFLRIGLRTDFMPVILTYCTSIVLWRQDLIRLTWTKLALAGAALFASGLFLNAVLSVSAMKGGLYGQGAVGTIERGARVMQTLGLENAPDAVLLSAGQADEYLLGPVYYFDFYYQAPYGELALGGHQFDMVARRFGNTSGPELKERVDELYLDMGIEHNVWATSIREMMMDFGENGALVAFAVFGLLLGLARKFAATMISARYLLSLFFTFLIVSPFFSTMKSSFFETGLYLGVLMFLLEAFSLTGRRSKALSVRASARAKGICSTPHASVGCRSVLSLGQNPSRPSPVGLAEIQR